MSFFVEKGQKNFFEKIPKIHFYCIFQLKFFVSRALSVLGNPLLGVLGPQKWNSPSLAEKIGG